MTDNQAKLVLLLWLETPGVYEATTRTYQALLGVFCPKEKFIHYHGRQPVLDMLSIVAHIVDDPLAFHAFKLLASKNLTSDF